jgi:hypothetical protein
MIRWLIRRWHARQRTIDLDILWPSCKNLAPDLDHAKAAFAVHAYHDPAWLELGEDAIYDFIDGLT